MNFEQIEEILRVHPKLVGVEDYEFAFFESQTSALSFHNGEPFSQTEDVRKWTSLRVIQRRQPGACVSTIKDSSEVDTLIDQALYSSQMSSADPWFRFPRWRSSVTPHEFTVSEPVSHSVFPNPSSESIHVEECLENVSSTLRLLRKTEKKPLVCKVSGTVGKLRMRLRGARYPVVNLARKLGSSRLFGLDPNLLPVFSELARGPEREKRTGGPILLSSHAASELIRLIGSSFVADSPRFSSETERSGDLSKLVTLIDDGRHPEGVFSYGFDWEGVPTQRTVLVNSGRWESCLVDTYGGGRINQLSTGNRFCPPGEAWPKTTPTTVFLGVGNSSPKELFSSLTNGIAMQAVETIEWIADKRIRLTGMGWCVDGPGNLKPFSRLTLEFNPLSAMRHVLAVGNDLEFYGTAGSPSILFEEMPL